MGVEEGPYYSFQPEEWTLPFTGRAGGGEAGGGAQLQCGILVFSLNKAGY